MIYFLDNSLQLQKIVTSKNINSAIHEHELNGLIRGDVELDLSYANKFLVLGIDHVGYYYKDEFYLHKIQRVEYDHVNETALIVLRHVFFEDMIFGKLIQDVRPQNQDALTMSRQTIDVNTRWQSIMTDVTGRLSTNFYWQVPYEVIEFMTENYRIEYLPKILFDGKKINGFQLHLANKIGEDKNIRIPFGSRVLDLKYEEDYSEIITKLVGHGKGEEVGDGHGRRINIADVNFSKNGVESPLGDVYMEDETVTVTYGNDGQAPREGRVIFEDIENVNELAQATYEHYLQVSRPQMLFTADVADIGDVGIGDSVMIIRREYDVYFKARIHKMTVDLLYPEDAQVELGDYEHFKESKVERKSREKNNRVQGQLSDRITRLKQEADERFDNEVAQWKSEYEQALIDVRAQIEADRENMTNLIEGARTEFTDNLNAEITQTKAYAEQQAQAKAGTVRTDLETVTSGHQALIDSLKDNVMNIDTFLGDKSKTLKQQFDTVRTDFGTLQTDLDGIETNLNTTKSDLQKQLDEARADLDGLEYENRNLLLDTNNEWTMPNTSAYAEFVRIPHNLNVVFDKYGHDSEYTISFDMKTADPSLANTIFSYPAPSSIPLNKYKFPQFAHRNVTEEYKRYSFTFKPELQYPEQESTRLVFYGTYGTGNIPVIRNIKLEKGKVNTDYSQAPEDTEQKITTLNQQIEFIDGQLSAKLEQTDLLPINNKITEYGNSLTANAQSIESLIRKTELHDGDITKWSNQTTANAESITSALSRISNTESGLTKAQTDITANADGLSTLITRVGETESGIESLSTSLTAEAGKVGALITKTDGHDTQLTSIEADTKNIKQSVSNITADYVKQSSVSVSADKVLIGSTAINGDALSSVISVSPTAIDLISDKINVTGNLNIKGGVTALAVDAIEGNFASLFAEELSTTTLESIHIGSESILAEHLKVSNVMAEKFMANSVMASSIKTLSLEAVYADVGNLRAEILTANVIRTGHLDVTTTMVEKFYSHSAFIGNATIKAANITDLNSITISANQIRGGTIQALDDSFYLNMMSGLMYFRNGANIRFYNEGLAVQHSLLNYTVGLGFQSHLTSREYPGVWLGGTTSSAVDPNHTTFTGMWAVPEKNDLQFTGRMFRFRAQQGLVNATERQIVLDMSQSSTVNLYPTGVDANNYNLGRPTYKWRSVWTNDLNNFRLVDLPNAQRLLYKDNGIEVNDSGNLIFIHKGSRYNLDYILNRI